MSAQTLFQSARKIDADGQVADFWMLVEGPDIVATGTGKPPQAANLVDVAGNWLLPGFIDLHGHGGGGLAYDDGAEAIAGALAAHRARGTTRSLISLVANPLDSLLSNLQLIAELAAGDPLILGSHLEGPYLAPEQRGAHNADFLREPDAGEVMELIVAGGGKLRQVTVAPELAGALEAIDVLVDAGVTVAIGHTTADASTAAVAFDRGARVLSHAFNAMPGIHHRSPGPVVAAFDDERIILELILDGHHVDPRVAHLTFRAAPGRVALVTDAMAAAGASDGDYRLGSLNVAVRDGLAMLRGTSTMAGSTLTQDAALRCAVGSADIAPREAVAALTLTPARALGIDDRFGLLAPGFAADAVVLDQQWQVLEVWADGQRIHGPT